MIDSAVRWENSTYLSLILEASTFALFCFADVCALRQDEGSCRQYTLKWYYDTVQNECLQFWYGGCDGNGNRFETKTDCVASCVKTR